MSDLHLDMPFTSLGDTDKANIRKKELFDCLKSIAERIMAQNIDLLIIGGDFFEDKWVKGATISAVKNLFSELYRTEIIICPGNHDPLNEKSYYKAFEWGSNVHILEDSRQVLYLEKYNTCIYNMGTGGNVKNDYPVILDKKLSDEKFNFLVFHGTVDMPFEENNYNSITSKEILSLGMDYVALGHMHCYFVVQNEKTIMINPGSPQPLGFDEEGRHGYIQGKIVASDENTKHAETEFISAASRYYHKLEVNISECISDKAVIDRILAEITAEDLYSVSLKGFISEEYCMDIKNIAEALYKSCFFIKFKNLTAIQFNYERYLEDPGIKGEFVRRIMDMQKSETTDEERETLFMALQYGLQALENGRVD
ncbi:DNA repair exonuclease SbcCD nuclease subunit [Ruminiclostridium sufflavum DSM 19573]|uniref:DNA repair exonuclease SbcCD nuclease subunit n=1 Tax=Ruminiclostridium sufflavum DSM 19573 TaxID=1121337 RepID=A0A318Y9E7_9FIRM|nr:DNA repair exonuclease [Ruminiclostridium sufflavum]PYG89023.1 DNA repair exonuclease SbcCD nuclease subunit [Ruminiclostridium sufflavum DSM 19573]